MQKPSFQEHIHPPLNDEISSVSGYYLLTQEKQFIFKGRKVLYYTGHAAVESSCCGAGGCAYAYVAGYIENWKYKKDTEGRDISRIEKIANESDRKEITDILKKKERVGQINFLE